MPPDFETLHGAGADAGANDGNDAMGRVPVGALPKTALHRMWLGLVRRCPICGVRWRAESLLQLEPVCRSCGLRLDRGEEDFFIGAYTVNFVTAELTAALFLAVVVVVTWPATPWTFIEYGGVALMILGPILFFPYSRTLWLAMDLVFRPPTAADFAPRDTPAASGDAAPPGDH